jgi:hypothetical protein
MSDELDFANCFDFSSFFSDEVQFNYLLNSFKAYLLMELAIGSL